MDPLTLSVLRSPGLEGCVGFKPEPVAEHSNTRSACTTAALRYLGSENNQYSVSQALSNLWPHRSEWLAPYIYFRRKGFTTRILRQFPAEAVHAMLAQRRPVLYLEHRHGGPWQVVVAFDVESLRYVLYDPRHPDLWVTQDATYFDDRFQTHLAVIPRTRSTRVTSKYVGENWLPKDVRCDLWYTSAWADVSNRRELWRRKSHAA